MAAVKLTPNVKASILGQINDKYNELKNAQQNRIEPAPYPEMCYRTVVSEELEQQALALPKDMVNYGETIRFIYDGKIYQLPLGRSRPLPASYENAYQTRVALPKSPPEEFQKLVQDIKINVAQLSQEHNTLNTDIKRVMESCRTLKQLLEIWPSALDFCDSSIRNRHARPETKRFKATTAEKLTDEAKLALVKVRMT